MASIARRQRTGDASRQRTADAHRQRAANAAPVLRTRRRALWLGARAQRPEHKRGAEAGWVLTNADEDSHGSCELLAHATEASRAKWGDWVVHLGPDGILNQRAVDAVLAHAARESRLSALSSSRARGARAAWRRAA